MPERRYLGIANVHGRVDIVESADLKAVQNALNEILARPRKDYPYADFTPVIYNVRPLRRKERRLLDNNGNNSGTL